jgi:hypothetical protein
MQPLIMLFQNHYAPRSAGKEHPMPLLMGPVLSFRGCDHDNWNLTAVVVAKNDPGPLTAGGQPVQPEILWEHKSGTAFRYTFAFPMGAAEAAPAQTYSVDGTDYEVHVPAIGQSPTMAYESCNGYSSNKLKKNVKDGNSLWKTMARKHGLPGQGQDIPEVKVTPYHLLLQGGDQVYADSMWEPNLADPSRTKDVMAEWLNKSWKDGNAAPATEKMRDTLEAFYFNLYTERWSQPEVKQILARIPSIAMWDDHDLIDGWGSYPAERQNCKVYGAIWDSAAKAFSVFQQHLKDGERHPAAIGEASPDWWKQPEGQKQPVKQQDRKGAFSIACQVGGVAILAIDMRSQRTSESQVVGATHWDEIYEWIEKDLADDISHLLVMSSIPVVYPGFDTLESLLDFVPGHQDLEDDLRDHWNSVPHKGERVRLIHNLLDMPKRNIRVTILSGDVHVAALGIARSTRADHTAANSEAVINQLISSGIVHPGPGAAIVFVLQHLLKTEDQIDRDIVGTMLPFPGTQAKFSGNRNYLSIEPDAKSDAKNPKPRLWCNWLVENQKFPYTKVVSPIIPAD